MRHIESDIQTLIDASVIDNDTAQSIRSYYHKQKNLDTTFQNIHNKKRYILTVLFSIFGALSIGAGIVLLFAHNWNILSRSVKIFIAILLLFIAQIVCVFVLIRKMRSVAWREGSICFLYFSFGASIALISQVYHIPGNINQFLFTVLMFMLPILYIFRSYAFSLLYILTTVWLLLDVSSSLDGFSYTESTYSYSYVLKYLVYLIPFIASLLFYIQFQKSIFPSSSSLRKISLIIGIQNWCISIAFLLSTVILILVIDSISKFYILGIWEIGYVLCFQVLYLFGNRVYPHTKILANVYRVVGILGLLIVMFYTIDTSPYNIYSGYDNAGIPQASLFLIITFLLSLLAHVFIPSCSMSYKYKKSIVSKIDIFEIFCVLFLFILVVQESTYQIVVKLDDKNLIAIVSYIVTVVLNVLILMTALLMLFQSVKKSNVNFRQLNFSVCIIIVWMILRFFNTDFNYLIRGIVFIVLGIVFLKINLFALKNGKNNISGA